MAEKLPSTPSVDQGKAESREEKIAKMIHEVNDRTRRLAEHFSGYGPSKVVPAFLGMHKAVNYIAEHNEEAVGYEEERLVTLALLLEAITNKLRASSGRGLDHLALRPDMLKEKVLAAMTEVMEKPWEASEEKERE